MTDRGLVRSAPFRSLLRSLGDIVGAEAPALLERAGIREDMPADAMMAFDAGATLLEDAARIANRDDVAIPFAKQLPWADIGVLAYVMLNAPTVGASLTHLKRYFAIQQRAAEFTLDVADGVARFRYAMLRAPHEPPRQHAHMIFALVVRFIREGSNDPAWHPTSLRLPFAAPRRTSDGLSYFGSDIEYGSEVAELVFPADVLRRANVTADPGLFPILVSHAEACLAKLPAVVDNELDQIRRLVSSLLGNGTVSIEEVADRLGTSARSLQRQLQEQGSSFKELVDDVRLGLARRHLAEPDVNLTDTAFLLGYSDLSAFSRAFRRWTGQSPQEYRRTQLR